MSLKVLGHTRQLGQLDPEVPELVIPWSSGMPLGHPSKPSASEIQGCPWLCFRQTCGLLRIPRIVNGCSNPFIILVYSEIPEETVDY